MNESNLSIPIANAHSNDYWFGYKAGQDDGKTAVFGIDDSCDYIPKYQPVHNYEQCAAGYYDGWNTTCHAGTAKNGNDDATWGCPVPAYLSSKWLANIKNDTVNQTNQTR